MTKMSYRHNIIKHTNVSTTRIAEHVQSRKDDAGKDTVNRVTKGTVWNCPDVLPCGQKVKLTGFSNSITYYTNIILLWKTVSCSCDSKPPGV